VYKNQGKKVIDEGILDALFVLKHKGKLKSTLSFPFFVQNYGSHDKGNISDWLVRFTKQAEIAKELRASDKEGLVPLTQDGQFWRAYNNSVFDGRFRMTIPVSKEYKRNKHHEKYRNNMPKNDVILQGMKKNRQK
jgi:hypothetical protein